MSNSSSVLRAPRRDALVELRALRRDVETPGVLYVVAHTRRVTR